MTGSSAHDQELMKFTTGLASQQYGDAHQRQMNEYGSEQLNRLGLAGMGQRSHEFGTGTMQRAHEFGKGQEFAQNRSNLAAQMRLGQTGLGQFNRQAGSLEGQADWLSNLATMSGQSRANRYMGDAQANQNMLGNLFGLGGTLGGAYLGGR